MKMRARFVAAAFAVAISLVLAGCGGGGTSITATPPLARDEAAWRSVHASTNAVVFWDNAALASVRIAHPAPTVTARALALVHSAIYDAWVPYDARAVGLYYRQARRPYRERTLANESEAISFAAYRTLADLFPADASAFSADMRQLGYDPNDRCSDPSKPQGIGNRAAAALLAARRHDGANQLGDLHPGAYTDYTGYKPVNTPADIVDPNRWQPLLVPNAGGVPTEQVYATPFWGLVKPFALASGAQLRPPPPPRYPGFAYIAQAVQILQYSATLNDTRKMIAEYWRDGPNSETPPGHWCLFAQYVSARDHHTLEADVKMFFAVSNALFDAGIAAWDAKRAYDSERPITAVHFLFRGRPVRAWAGPYNGTRIIDGADWIPYQPANVVTPPFAEFVSGHSAFSAAAAQVLRYATGSDRFGASIFFPAGSSTVEPRAVPAAPLTLSWSTFSDAAEQAALSRRYGGIHFADGDLRGRQLGRAAGTLAWIRATALFNGISR